ncbi:MAG: 23S rRNA (guanosine(2251)-2'-O)-methyltransferase RlmB [Egibacteraceae bacterium]
MAEPHAIPGRRPVTEALRAGRALQRVWFEDRADLTTLVAAAEQAGVDVAQGTRAELDALAYGVAHQGIVGIAALFRYARLDELAETDLVVVLDGVTDPQNLGAIARSAEQAGAGALVLPRRRSAMVTAAAEKASAGAFSWLSVAVVPNITRALADLAGRGFWSVGLAGEGPETLWDAHLLDGPVAVVVGAEGRGLSRLVRERVDALVRIPMRGRLDSLNVSAATAVALFEVVRRRRRREGVPPTPG